MTFEIYAYRPLTKQEIDREIALYMIERPRIKVGKTYRVFSCVDDPAKNGS